MCLIDYKEIDMGEREKPIKCYKVFKKTNGFMESPIYGDYPYGSSWGVGSIRHTEWELPYSAPTNHFGEDVKAIHGGCFHTFKTLKGARNYRDWLKSIFSRLLTEQEDFVITQCEIPLESTFAYVGTAVVSHDDHGIPGYVSESLKVVKLVK